MKAEENMTSKLSAFIPPNMRQRLTFCKTSVFLITGVTGLVISTDGMSCSSSSVPQLPSLPPLQHPSPLHSCVCDSVLGLVWCVWGRLGSCIFQRKGIKHRLGFVCFFFFKEETWTDLPTVSDWCFLRSLVKYCGDWGLSRGVHTSWLWTICLSSHWKAFPPCLSRQITACLPALFLPSTLEGAKAETCCEASGQGYQINNNSSPVIQGMQK